MRFAIRSSAFVVTAASIFFFGSCSPSKSDDKVARDSSLAGDTAGEDSLRADSLAMLEAEDDKPCFASHFGLACN